MFSHAVEIMKTPTLPTNLKEAEEQNFNVVMLPTNATELIELTRSLHAEYNTQAAEFIHEICCGKLVFKLHCLAVKPRPGVIAPEMKKRKALKCSEQSSQ